MTKKMTDLERAAFKMAHVYDSALGDGSLREEEFLSDLDFYEVSMMAFIEAIMTFSIDANDRKQASEGYLDILKQIFEYLNKMIMEDARSEGNVFH